MKPWAGHSQILPVLWSILNMDTVSGDWSELVLGGMSTSYVWVIVTL